MLEGGALELVVEAAPVAIVLVDGDGRITLINAQGERLFGYDHNELVGETIERLVPNRYQALHPSLRDGYLAVPATRAMGFGRDLYGLRKDGTEVQIEIGLNPIATPQGQFTLATIIDVTERRRAEEHLRLVVEAAPNAIVVADGSGAIELVNGQAERLFGYTRDELLGASVEVLVPQRFRGGHRALREGYLASPTTRSMGAGRELFGLRKDGTEVPIEIGLSPLRTPKGDFVLASVIDITERKHGEELRLQRDRALDASRLKSQFVATMSHELRTPLNAIIGMGELLSATELDERQRTYVETIDESAEALLAIISSILDFSKIEAGKIDLEEQDFELENLVASTVGVLTQQIRRKGLALHTYLDPAIPPIVRGDADRLRQILLNLVGNAAKFTTEGHVVVRATPVETSSRHVVVRFEVEDSGVGIASDVVPLLFEPFVQGDGSSSRQYGGTGLGLSISKRIVEMMDGTIGVATELGHGSVFWFTARFGRQSAAGLGRRIFGVRALLVSADPLLRDILSRYVDGWGMPYATAIDVTSAAAALRSA
ncbi:MAG: PAS domain S-box protein, partial [Candidatus Eremiobacteraeota bacterium]|nr:PAS domain S-box protein [Candidatus Eremiobacteraeota bacterium]